MANLSNINNKFLVTTGGNVGIGTTSPGEKLDVSGGHIKITNTGNTNLYINANNSGSDSTIFFQETGSVKAKIQHDASNDSMLFTDGAYTDTMTLKGGNVGIGTDSPDVKIHAVASGTKISPLGGTVLGIQNNSSTSTNCWISALAGNAGAAALVLGDVDDNDQARFQFNNSGRLLQMLNAGAGITIDTSGNVGIGTTNPSSKFQVEGAPANGTYLSYLYNSATHNSAHGLNVQTTTNNILTYGLRVNTGGDSNALAVMGNGTVGIGTNSPGAKLHVLDSNFPQVRINDETGAGESGIRMRSYNGSTNDLHGDIFVDASSGIENGRMAFRVPWNTEEKVTILSNGNVGIGTTSPSDLYADQLVVKCSSSENGITILSNSTTDANYLMFADGTSGDDRFRGQIAYSHQDNFMAFAVNASNKMYIQENGNVGIGRSALLNNALTVTKSDANANFYETLAAIEICNSNTNTGKWRALNFKVGAGNYSETLGGIYCQYEAFSTNVVGNMVFATRAANSTNVTEKMRIDSNGAVGIGRNTASYRLSLISESSGTVQNGVYISAGTGNGNHSLYVENQDGTAEFFAVRGDGEIRLNASNQGHTYARTGVRLGANAAANNLDDYEEGTFTMTMNNDGVGNTVTSRYTKVGRLVFIESYFSARTISNAGNCRVAGLPFSADHSEGYGVLTYWHGTAISQNTTVFYVQGTIADGIAPGTTSYSQWVTGSNKAMMLAGFYTTA